MFIVLTREGRVELRETGNFRAFMIVDEAGHSRAELATALEGIASVSEDARSAWVHRSAVPLLLPNGPTQEWLEAFEAMIAKARQHRWVNDADGTFRAHIEVKSD